MPRKKSARRQSLERAALYPLDWLEERSGIVGGVRYFLFRKVPGDTNWFHTLGSATLTAFLVQLVTGVILAFYYRPDPKTAHASIEHITNDITLGWLVRGMHRWGASVFIILMFMHMGRVFLFGAYKYPRELNWIVASCCSRPASSRASPATCSPTPPWSPEAAGREPEMEPPPARSGLVQPRPRASGVRGRPTE